MSVLCQRKDEGQRQRSTVCYTLPKRYYLSVPSIAAATVLPVGALVVVTHSDKLSIYLISHTHTLLAIGSQASKLIPQQCLLLDSLRSQEGSGSELARSRLLLPIISDASPTAQALLLSDLK